MTLPLRNELIDAEADSSRYRCAEPGCDQRLGVFPSAERMHQARCRFPGHQAVTRVKMDDNSLAASHGIVVDQKGQHQWAVEPTRFNDTGKDEFNKLLGDLFG